MTGMAMRGNFWQAVRAFILRQWAAFSYIGLLTGTLSFAASLTPSLLPRQFVVQGVLSGLAFAVGYGVGKLFVVTWQLFQVPMPRRGALLLFRWTMALIALGIAVWFLAQATKWQNSIRELMGMPPEATAYPRRVAVIAALTGLVIIWIATGVRWFWRMIDRRLARVVPPRVSFVISTVTVALIGVLVLNNVFARFALRTADRIFLNLDSLGDGHDKIPTDPLTTGSKESLIKWDTVGRRGKEFIAAGPKQSDIAKFLGRPAKQPIRVYAGYRSMDNVEERARLALDELKRVGGFDRSVLIIVTPTGTGWVDQNAVDPVEYMHAGDTAIVAMGYSYLPSWMTLLVDPDRARASAHALFEAVYGYWTTLPHERRPKLYLHGLSLGSLGAETSGDLYMIITDPIQGAVFSGPPFPSELWRRIEQHRNPDSPSWLPTFHDGSIVRFTGRRNTIDDFGARWGALRVVYIQHPSDPMVFFSPDLLYREPAWLRGQRGPDVSPYLRWFPIVTCLQMGFDLPMATSVPMGFGHNYDAGSYIDAWAAVTDPPNWSRDDTQRLKEKFAGVAHGPSFASP
jgi:uncharacterized membrane protein